jgi:excinuclease ABC subunit C
LLKKSVALETITTESEKEALLLEADLISTHKPLFNRLLTSSTPFTYIICDPVTVDLPQMKMTRSLIPREGELVIGPFLTKKEAWIVYKTLLEFFNLDSCGKNIPGGCLQFHIGKCAGSCRLNFDKASYRKRFVLARTLFSDEVMFERIIEKEIKNSIKKFEFDRVEELTAYKNEYKKYFISLFEKGGEVQDRIEDVLLDLSLKEEIVHQALLRIKEIFQLNNLPKTVDCIDISHFQGHSAVGSCVRFANGLFSKKKAKRIKCRSISIMITLIYRFL